MDGATDVVDIDDDDVEQVATDVNKIKEKDEEREKAEEEREAGDLGLSGNFVRAIKRHGRRMAAAGRLDQSMCDLLYIYMDVEAVQVQLDKRLGEVIPPAKQPVDVTLIEFVPIRTRALQRTALVPLLEYGLRFLAAVPPRGDIRTATSIVQGEYPLESIAVRFEYKDRTGAFREVTLDISPPDDDMRTCISFYRSDC
jgi:hypothetical protein